MSYLIVFLGAGLGGAFRWFLSTWVQRLSNGWLFPIGTFTVNMVGCLAIGLLGQLAESKGLFTSDARLFMMVGFLGGFTTFSSFGYDTLHLITDGDYLYAAANAVLQVVVGLFFVWLGTVVARLI